MSRTFALAAAMALTIGLTPAIAQAESLPEVTLGEVFAGYRAICAAHMGDGKAQAAAGAAAPYNFERDGATKNGTTRYKNGRMVLVITGKDGRNFCSVMAVVDESIRPDVGIDVARPVFGEPTSRSENIAMWKAETKDKPGSHMFLTLPTEDGTRLAGFMAIVF